MSTSFRKIDTAIIFRKRKAIGKAKERSTCGDDNPPRRN